VRIEAEMKTPGSATVQRLQLKPGADDAKGVDLEPGNTLQKIVSFDLKEEGNHVLAVTVSYYEATETSGRTRTFRKLYQFICKGSLIVRTKVGRVPSRSPIKKGENAADEPVIGHQRWILEAQLENCSEDVMQLEHVGLELENGLKYQDANWMVSKSAKPVLHPGEVEQVCFVVEENGQEAVPDEIEGKIVFGVLGIAWRTEMGNRGFLSTGKLGTKATK
jgi:trafficking protein particle complex subunit 13